MTNNIIKQSGFPAIVFIAGVLLCTFCYTTLAVLSHSHSEINLLLLLGLSALCAIASGIIVLLYQQQGGQISFAWIIVSAIAFRAIGVLGQPILEDDFYRYLWDGYQMITSGNPYALPPSAFFTDTTVPAALEEVLSRISYPDVATVYGPVCQWLFAAAFLFDPGSIWPLQIISALADIAIILLLWSIRQNNFILLYAWSPLLIKEFAFTAHTDIIAVFFAVAAVKCQKCDRPWLTGALLALATGTKVFALVLLPFLLFRRGNTRFLISGLLGFVMVVGLITWSFGTTLIWFPEGLRVMANAWLFNAPVYLLLVNQLSFNLLKLLLLALFVIFAASHFSNINGFTGSTANDRLFRGDWLFGIFLLCLPAVNPWYLAWVLPFAVITPSRWAWTASGCVLLSYASGTHLHSGSLGPHQIPASVLILEYGLVAMALLYDKVKPPCVSTDR